MADYYVNRKAQPNGDHEVHDKAACPPQFFPSSENALYLGSYSTCAQAVQAARTYFSQVNGCIYCSPACHTQ